MDEDSQPWNSPLYVDKFIDLLNSIDGPLEIPPRFLFIPPVSEFTAGYSLGWWARYYAVKMAWRVFPLKPRGKTPLTQHGFKDATVDVAQIDRWWTKHPDANIGIACGDGLFVLDFDGDAGMESFSKVFDRPLVAPVVKTHHGVHVYCRGDGPNTAKKFLPGMDTRGTGGYVVAPPSIHPDGGAYAWAPNLGPDTPLVEVPPLEEEDEWMALVRNGVPEGQRDDTAVRLIGHFKGIGKSKNDIHELLRQFAAHCQPPLPEEVVAEKVERLVPATFYRTGNTGNAERFRDLYADTVKFCQGWNNWVRWNDCQWKADQGVKSKPGPVVDQLMKGVLRSLYEEAKNAPTEAERKMLSGEAVKGESYSARTSALDAAKSEMPVRVEDFDANINLLNFPNGTLELDTLTFREHRRDEYLSKVAGGQYVEGATSEVWDNFLHDTIPDEETLQYVQRCVGYSVLGTANERKAFIVHGPAGSGKSTFILAIQRAMGDYSVASNPKTFSVGRQDHGGVPRSDLVRLAGVRHVSVNELPEGMKLDTALLKGMTGGDPITARTLFQVDVQFQPQFVPWFAGNHLPQASADDAALWERLKRIPFEQGRDAKDQDRGVQDKLKERSECQEAILWWIVEGVRAYREHGLLGEPPLVVSGTQKWRQEMNRLSEFIEECCELGEGLYVASADLHAEYLRWVESERGRKKIKDKDFSASLKLLGCRSVSKYIDKKQVRVWEELALKRTATNRVKDFYQQPQSVETEGEPSEVDPAGYDLPPEPGSEEPPDWVTGKEEGF